MKKILLPVLLLLILNGCQSAPSPTVTRPAPPPKPSLQELASALPVAQVVSTAEGILRITYPQESLFSSGAVLPFAGGAEALDPLAALLRDYPQITWAANVRAATAHGADYDLALARKRSELLQRYLRNSGVAAGQVTWKESRGEGIPLELTQLLPVQPPPASSSGAKP